VTGRYNPRLKLPQIPLSDGAGEIVAIGSEVKTAKAGDRVTSTFFERWYRESRPTKKPGRRWAPGGTVCWPNTSCFTRRECYRCPII